MTNRKLLGFLWVLPILSVALPRAAWAQAAVAAALPDFDHQLERFTELAMEGKVVAAEAFLREAAFIRSVDREGHTALFAATAAGNLQILERVLALSPNLDLGDVHGATALFYSATGGTAVLARLIQRGADVNLQDQRGRSPLIAAVLMNHLGAAGLLLVAGADVNRQDRHGATALFYAAESGFFELAELLLERGADPALANDSGITPTQIAADKSFSKIARLLRY
ncbi:MAG TPA: ankyrin repeat domain-containing protein [Thermoanaerobaculia bacterium]|jgi:ankyrin repeat protein|nr:ankyrin repeat domain-containing protein [Thermoanaerobaculia bacterium]